MADSLLKKRVSIKDPSLLQYFYPNFILSSNIDVQDDYSKGVIYTGLVTDAVIKKIDYLTNGKYIVVSSFGDVQLDKPSDFIEVFIPGMSKKAYLYNNYPMEEFIPVLKKYYILQKKIPLYEDRDLKLFLLYKSLVGSRGSWIPIFIDLLEDMPVNVLASSILTFLINVKDQVYINKTDAYKRVINTATLKFGGKIYEAVSQYSKSILPQPLALFTLLADLAL